MQGGFPSAFEAHRVDAGSVEIFIRRAGSGPALLLLHGFPQSHLMWRDIAPRLAADFTVCCADLPGYGESGCPAPASDHRPHSKRDMAGLMVTAMEALGHRDFAVVGHDRGGRVAYRTALDHPDRITRLAVLDVLPIDFSWGHADARMTLGFWPWSLMAQPAPLPERLVGADPEAVIEHVFGGAWGSPEGTFDDDVRAAYGAALAEPRRLRAICEEYRAAAGVDREDDADDRNAGRKISCPLLALWSKNGPLNEWYSDDGGPLAVWREMAGDVSGGPVAGGHFFPEEHPEQTVQYLRRFFEL